MIGLVFLIKGFIFSVKLNDEGYPSAILYMTLRMRQNCIRFSDVLFLAFPRYTTPALLKKIIFTLINKNKLNIKKERSSKASFEF